MTTKGLAWTITCFLLAFLSGFGFHAVLVGARIILGWLGVKW